MVANSDSHADQEIKLIVRDKTLEIVEPMLYDCKSVQQALSVFTENRHLVEQTANSVLKENGCNMDAKVVVGKKYYPEKTYEGIVFPEGEYLSVRVLIGEGKGKNWWCVLFPRLKTAGVTEQRKLVLSDGIDKKEADAALKNEEKGSVEIFDCRVRLKIADLFLKGR